MSTYILNTFKISYMIKNNVSLLIGMRRMTIAETARLAGVSYNTIYALYHDQTAGIEFATLNKLCEVLDCTTNDLLNNTIYNLYYDKTAGIDFNTLDRLCFALDCTPNDLLKYSPEN